MENIDAHIDQDKKILDDLQTSSQSRKHIEDELASLEAYKANHPEDNHDPTALELFCDGNQSASECRVYDN
jgi:hypothetical protein